MSSYLQRQRRRRREADYKKALDHRRSEEYRLRDLQGESLYDFIKKQMPGLPHTTDARRMSPATVIGFMLKYKRDLRADDNYLARWAAANNDLPLLQKLHAHGADLTVYNNYIPRHFAKHDNLEALIWLRDQGISIAATLENLMGNAANRNNLPRMKTLLRIDPALCTQHNHAINSAAQNGKLLILKWYKANGATFDYNDHECGNYALQGGHRPVLDYLEKNGVDMQRSIKESTLAAAANGKLETFKWLDERGIAYDLNLCARQAANGVHVPLLRHLYAKGARLDNHFEFIVMWHCGDKEDRRDLLDFLLSERHKRNAHYVTDAMNQAVADTKKESTPPTLTRRLLGKFGWHPS